MESEPIPKHIWQTAAVVSLGPLMTQLDSTVVNLSLPTLQQELHAPIETVQWVISGYLLALAMAQPANAWLVNKMGARHLYIWCFSAFTLASLLCGLSNSITFLIAARALQGIVGGLLMPMTQMMMIRIAGRRIAKVMGYTAVPVLIAPLFGPVLAGMILKHLSWPWLFYINLPIGILAVALAAGLLPNDEPSMSKRSFDVAGFMLISAGLVSFLYGLQHSFAKTGQLSSLLGFLLLVLFILHSAKHPDTALLDIELFKVRDFSTTAIALFLNTGAMFAGQMLIPLYLIDGCKLSSSNAGCLVAIMGIGMLCSYPFVGSLVEKLGARRVAVCAALMLTLATVPIFWMADNRLNVVLICACLFIRGAGQGGIGIPVLSVGYSKIPRERLSQATTASNIVQRLGGPIATTAIAIVMSLSSHTSNLGNHIYALPFAALICLQLILLCSALRLPACTGLPLQR